MEPKPAISGHFISEKRAAAARANGGKSRGPVTAQGRANSSRNGLRHGLRAKTHGVVDQDSLDRLTGPLYGGLSLTGPLDPVDGRDGQLIQDKVCVRLRQWSGGLSLTSLLASYTRLFQPQSEIERGLVETMALARWRRTCCWKQETDVLNREVRRLKSLMPDEDSATLTGPLYGSLSLMALAFQSLSGNGCSLDLINRLESRCDRQHDRALDRLIALKSPPTQSPRNGTFEKLNTSERTQQAVENTDPHSGTTHEMETSRAQSNTAGNRDPKKVIMSERTQQAAENTGPHSELAPFSPGLAFRRGFSKSF